MYDVMIIGAGVSGSAAARELSRYDLKIAVLEREEDVCCGTSKANSGIVHAGFDAACGSLKAKMNVRGNQMMGELAEELDFPFQRIGSLVLCFRQEDRPKLEKLKNQGEENGVLGIRILEQEELREMEPNISPEAVAALYAPSGGIVCPFGFNIALAENAGVNGVEFYFDTEVTDIRKTETGYRIFTDKGEWETRCVVNAAGVYADKFHNMVSEKKLHITVRKGEYYLLDRSTGNHVHHTIFQLPGKYGKGVLVTPTIHGNLLVGPTAKDIEDKEGTQTTAEGMAEVGEKAVRSVKDLPLRQVITSFAGLRAHEEGNEFVIGEAEDAPGFFDCAGIESPGLSSAPAIGELLAELVTGKLKPAKKENFISRRKGILNPRLLTKEEWKELIKKQPAYGNVICRCESITEGEILDAIHRPLGAKSLDGVKRRTRAGMGRCQAGFCSPKTMEILAREWKVPMESLTKSGKASKIIQGTAKDSL
ncbi:MAG: NAD(P)/FAD-dependent oxidoreductase [Clostridiales bacterium]|nr:NAD(P)/FAD-dependent oxidoreductase [Clostridiales bacterium]